MTVTVKFFAVLRDRADTSETTLNLSDGESIIQATEQLATTFPAIEHLLSKVAFAVNECYVPINTTLHDGDELAIIPPVSGG